MLQFPTLFYPLSFLINTHEISTRTHSIILDNPELTALFLRMARKEEISILFESHDFFKDNLQSYFCFDVAIPALGLGPHAMLPSMPFLFTPVCMYLFGHASISTLIPLKKLLIHHFTSNHLSSASFAYYTPIMSSTLKTSTAVQKKPSSQ